ncbi:MAG TPA: hypothetical protein PLI95_07610 [Polyangiaceae bacterium]|nr:hypothetical protein [Polyangiaceae bacterium]
MAVALFDDEVSPRFCQARSAAVYRWDGATAHLIGYVELDTAPYPDRLQLLAARGAEFLVCGAFPVEQRDTAEALGMRIVCGVSGPVRAILERLASVLAGQASHCRLVR